MCVHKIFALWFPSNDKCVEYKCKKQPSKEFDNIATGAAKNKYLANYYGDKCANAWNLQLSMQNIPIPSVSGEDG